MAQKYIRNCNMRKITAVVRPQHRSSSARAWEATVYDEDYKPWTNELSNSGTTREIVENNIARNPCVDPALELQEVKSQHQAWGVPDILAWSAANRTISEIEDGEITYSHLPQNDVPSAYGYNHMPRTPMRYGLYKPIQKPCFRYLE